MMTYPEQRVAITGAGQSTVARVLPQSALQLTVSACRRAVESAGLEPGAIDGICSYPGVMDNGNGFSPVGLQDVRMAMGLKPTWYAATAMESAGQMSAFFAAIHALASGVVRHVLVFRTTGEGSARQRQKGAMVWGGSSSRVSGMWQWAVPYGAFSPAPWYATFATRYQHEYGLTPEQLGAVAVNARRMAALNPSAVYRTPLSLADYLESRLIASPLRLYDCDVPVDGATAFVLSQQEAWVDCAQSPLRFASVGHAFDQGGLRQPTDLTSFGAEAVGRMLWARTDLTPDDLDVAQIYDGFSILTLHWLEALQLCPKGEAGRFVEGGERIGLDGSLPMNTSGGQLSAGRLHGFGHVYEACLQLWGLAGQRQVPDARVALACAGAYGLGAMILMRD